LKKKRRKKQTDLLGVHDSLADI